MDVFPLLRTCQSRRRARSCPSGDGRRWEEEPGQHLLSPEPSPLSRGHGGTAGSCPPYRERDHFPLGPRGNPGTETRPKGTVTSGRGWRQSKVRSSAPSSECQPGHKSSGIRCTCPGLLGREGIQMQNYCSFHPCCSSPGSHGSPGSVPPTATPKRCRHRS